MIRYIVFFDRVADRHCSDLIPVDDSLAMVLRCAKRFSLNKYCKFVKLNEIECRTVAKWDSEKNNGLDAFKKPLDVFTLDKVDELYVDVARRLNVEKIEGVTVPEVKTDVSHGDFVREVEKIKVEGDNNEQEQI